MPVAKINSFDFLCEQHGKHRTRVVLLNTEDVNLWEEKSGHGQVGEQCVVGWGTSALALHPAKWERGRARWCRGGQSMDLENQDFHVFRAVILF